MFPSFDIGVDIEHEVLRLRVFGPMSPDDIDALFRERARLLALLPCAPGCHRVLIDARQAPVQDDDTVDRIEMRVAGLMLDTRRAAIVLDPGATPGRLQFRDLGARYNLYLFDRMEDAEKWIRF